MVLANSRHIFLIAEDPVVNMTVFLTEFFCQKMEKGLILESNSRIRKIGSIIIVAVFSGTGPDHIFFATDIT